MPNKPNLYQVLQVDPRADAELIRMAYIYLAEKYGPGSKTADAKMFDRLTDAWRVLHDESTRAEYDEILLGGVEIEGARIEEPEPAEFQGWTADELRIAILQILLAVKKEGVEGGIFDSQIVDILRIDMFTLKSALAWLQAHELIDNVASRSTISAAGIEHLKACLGPAMKPAKLPEIKD